jgi:hypothetical protein
MPGESPAIFGDALRRLAGAATYLYPVVSPKNYTPGLSIRSVSVPPAPYDGS